MRERTKFLCQMGTEELTEYVYECEREIGRLSEVVRKQSRKSRCHRKSMREMQAKLEKYNLMQPTICRTRPAVEMPADYAPWPQDHNWSTSYGRSYIGEVQPPCNTK